jgi:hypothetical protein
MPQKRPHLDDSKEISSSKKKVQKFDDLFHGTMKTTLASLVADLQDAKNIDLLIEFLRNDVVAAEKIIDISTAI